MMKVEIDQAYKEIDQMDGQKEKHEKEKRKLINDF